MTPVDTMQMARAEREVFVALLEGLTPQQWDSPTLCKGWRVRDVVAHVIGYDPLNRMQLLGWMAKGLVTRGGSNAVEVANYAGESPEELIALMRRYAVPQGITAGFGGRIALTDGMIHQQDIRRPLGLPRTISTEPLRIALDFTKWAPRLLGAMAGPRGSPGGHRPGLGVREGARGSGERRGPVDGDGRPPRRVGRSRRPR